MCVCQIANLLSNTYQTGLSKGEKNIYITIYIDSSPSIFKTQIRGGIPKPREKKEKIYISRVANSSRNLSPAACFADFVELRCRFVFLSRCPGLGSEGKGGNWYLVSRARWLLILPAPNTYLPIATALCLCFFFQFASLLLPRW